MTGSETVVRQAFESHEAFEHAGDEYRVTTTVFEASVAVDCTADVATYTVKVELPTLDAATDDDVGPTVSLDWFETLERRLQDAPKATRADVALEEFDVTREKQTVTVKYTYSWENPRTAPDIAKTFVEYAEGTYAEGIIPGYEYNSPVADLLASASQGGEGGTPL